MVTSLLYADVISFFVTSKCQKIRKLMKIVNPDEENLHIFWTTCGVSLKCSGKMWIITILEVTKNQCYTISLEDTFLNTPQEGVKLTPPPPPLSFLMVKMNPGSVHS